jgi:hypothetical protein
MEFPTKIALQNNNIHNYQIPRTVTSTQNGTLPSTENPVKKNKS